MKRFTLLMIALMAMTSVMAQLNPLETIPADPEVRIGKLSNGMTYYLRHNEKPKSQADFYILHNVGAIQENDRQQGLAHFLEHMAFNGTKNLPDKQLIEYLESVGVKFGADLNAYTMHDITCYNLSNVPTTRQGIIDSALLILHDWSNFISLEEEEIDNERGVIQQELRTRDNAEFRSMNAMIENIGKGSKYAERNVIGHLEGLQSFTYDELRDFYELWYRPEYQAIIVVGDIDVDAIEAQLIELMADVPASPADAPAKEAYMIPDNAEPIVYVFADPEMTASNIKYIIKRPAMPAEQNNLVLSEMVSIMNIFAGMMANNRFHEIAMQPDAPFLSAYMGASGALGNTMPTLDAVFLSAQTRDGELLRGFEALSQEMEKIRRFGFTEGEFERTKAELLSRIEAQYAQRTDRTNASFVNRYMDHYLSNTPIPDAETEYNLDRDFIENYLTLEDVNAWTASLLTPENQVILFDSPEKEGVVVPTAEEILAVREQVMNAEIEAYVDNTVIRPLIAEDVVLKGSPVKKTKVNEELGTTEWTLKNGVKIIVKPSTLKADEVQLVAKAEGGKALLPNEDVIAADMLTAIMSMSGLSDFSGTELNKQLAGKMAQASIGVGQYSSSVSGYSTPKDLETMLQLVYLNFTSPRFSEEDFTTTINMYKSYMQNVMSNPDYLMQIALQKELYNDSPRVRALTVEALDEVKFERLPEIYRTLFPGANSFTFTIVGNVDLETLKPLVEKYIGSIPTTKKANVFTDDNTRFAKGGVEHEFKTPMQQPKVSLFYVYTGDTDYSLKERLTMRLLSEALSSRYHIEIREKKGGTYGVGVGSELAYRPVPQYLLQIAFDTSEEMYKELDEIIFLELEKMAAEGPLAEDVEKNRKFFQKSFKNSLEENNFWFQIIEFYNRHNINYLTDYEPTLQAITYEDIRAMAARILEDGHLVKVTMRPELAAEAVAEAPAEEAAEVVAE